MKPLSLPPGQVWMVDDESELVGATVNMLSRELGPNLVRGSTDPREVAQWIDKERPAALITDVRMPHVNGLELVTRLHQRWGPVPVVVMTAYPTAQVEQDARGGRFAYLPKPFSFHTLLETLGRVCDQPAPSAFSGAIAVSMLGEVVQLYGLANRTGVLRIESPAGLGQIWFESGSVTDAQAPDLRGVGAFNAILAWTSGNFSWHAGKSGQRTIHQGLSELLLEAYRLLDERAAGKTGELSEEEVDALASLEPSPAARAEPVPGNIHDQLGRLARAEGFTSAALIELDQKVCVASLAASGIEPVDELAMGHAALVTAKRNTIAKLHLGDEVQDIVITLKREYHLLRVVGRDPRYFFFLTLERKRANLAMARYLLSEVESDVVL